MDNEKYRLEYRCGKYKLVQEFETESLNEIRQNIIYFLEGCSYHPDSVKEMFGEI